MTVFYRLSKLVLYLEKVVIHIVHQVAERMMVEEMGGA